MEGRDRSMGSRSILQREQLPMGESVPEDLLRPQLGEPHHCAFEIHVDNEGLHGFFAMVRSGAEGWDGSEPLRPIEP